MQEDPAWLGGGSSGIGTSDWHCVGECEKPSQYPSDRAESEINSSGANLNPQRKKKELFGLTEEFEA